MSFRDIVNQFLDNRRPPPPPPPIIESVTRHKQQKPLHHQGTQRITPVATTKPARRRTSSKPFLVLHGRIVHDRSHNDDDDDDTIPGIQGVSSSTSSSLHLSRSSEEWSPRKKPNNTSQYAQLAHDHQVLSKLVSELEHLLQQPMDRPEVAWKTRILQQSAVDSARLLQSKLEVYITYSHSTTTPAMASGRRKLQRDVQRTGTRLQQLLQAHKRRQRAQVNAALHAKEFLPHRTDNNHWQETMKQAELEKLNSSMHQVQDLYQELATHVVDQQDDIDIMEAQIRDSQRNVEQGARHLFCLSERLHPYCGDNTDWSIAPYDNDKVSCGGWNQPDNTIRLNDDDDEVDESDCAWKASYEDFRLSLLQEQTRLDPEDIFEENTTKREQPTWLDRVWQKDLASWRRDFVQAYRQVQDGSCPAKNLCGDIQQAFSLDNTTSPEPSPRRHFVGL